MRVVKVAINKSQRAAWNDLISEIDKDPWDRPYKIVMKRVGNRESLAPIDYLSISRISEIVCLLFLVKNRIEWHKSGIVGYIPEVIGEEVESALKTEALLFCQKGVKSEPFRFMFDSVPIITKESMRYLGVTIDDRWRFSEHLRNVALKAEKFLNALNNAQLAGTFDW
ncbi:hypothetical protein P5V15_005844 [Pogonomyrmex californicus]